MNDALKNFLILSVAYLALFGLCEWLYHRFRWNAENTRKIAHAGSGILALSFPFFFQSFGYVAALCGAFLLILYVTKRFKVLRSIHGIARVSYGSSMFPIVVAICFWFYVEDFNITKFYLPVLIMALADPVACLVGRRFPIAKLYGKKTWGGSLAFFAVAFVLSLIFYGMYWIGPHWLPIVGRCVAIALVATTAEAVSNKGFDNLTIPLSTLAALMV